jgi:hypothetical protein
MTRVPEFDFDNYLFRCDYAELQFCLNEEIKARNVENLTLAETYRTRGDRVLLRLTAWRQTFDLCAEMSGQFEMREHGR